MFKAELNETGSSIKESNSKSNVPTLYANKPITIKNID